MKVTLIGSSGYIGTHLLKRLQALSELEVAPFSSKSDISFNEITGIISDDFVLPKNTDCVIYLSQSPYYRDLPNQNMHLWGVNVVSAIKIAEMARRNGVAKFIYASTGNVYVPTFARMAEKDPLRRDDFYALSKVHAEEALSMFRSWMDVTFLRIFAVYGPNQKNKLIPNIIGSVKTKSPIKLAPRIDKKDIDGLRFTPCYIRDAIDIFVAAIFHSVDVLNLAGPEVLSVKDIAEIIGDILKIDPVFEVLDQPRNSDLIADIDLLRSTFNPNFTMFSEGIERTLNS